MKTITLKPGRGRSLKNRHPWVYSGAIDRAPADAAPGETVMVVDDKGGKLAAGAWSPASQIAVRIWTFDTRESIDADFLRHRLQRAIARRDQDAAAAGRNARRLVNGESDGLPGLIVDAYGEWLVCQFLSAGVEYWRDVIADLLMELRPSKGCYERSEADVREKEKLPRRTGLVRGEEPPELIEIQLGELRFLVDVRKGHKTGFYLDQAENLDLIRRSAQVREVLNGFAYTGAFAVAALKGGASRVVSIESSREAMDLAARNLELNACDATKVEQVNGDVFNELRRFRDAGRSFDLALLDPPKFVVNAGQVQRGGRAYKDANLLAIKLLRPGGRLVTFSCSGHVTPDLFQKIVADAAVDSGRGVQILHWLSQAPDHPVSTNFPEGRYLKGLVCRVD
ncbi:MAG: class I SAM-dependent methyltransferase [Gammaproteobacteria bacterium]|nr:class I SAM-dependent methyltransferase [Gammaproteobacteria bacterium]